MKKSPLLEQLRRETTVEIKREIDLSFQIADRIFEILTKKNLTQRDLAAMLGKSEAEISKWMRGTHNFATKTIAKIEVILGEPIIEVTGKP
ncbi:MAG: helix-turn-helix domain-containing protein [Paludibacter sp.]|nr:helix-turn-helix domain-containing protein [Paludibacter sp.]